MELKDLKWEKSTISHTGFPWYANITTVLWPPWHHAQMIYETAIWPTIVFHKNRTGLADYLSFLCHPLDFLIGFTVSNTVTNTNAMALNQGPVVYNSLNVAIETTSNFMTKFNGNNVDQTAWRGSQWFLT